MAIEQFLIRGDCHGTFNWVDTLKSNNYEPEKTAIIVLGDCGFDFYLNRHDERKKKEIDAKGYYIYWLRGNHEARPKDVPGYEVILDENVHGFVYYDPRFPHLRSFMDYDFYKINGHSCLVIGGAYSVDKYWRLARNQLTEETNDPKKTGWFANEQLSKEEMENCERTIRCYKVCNNSVDFIMTHTCPTSFQPTDMFLGAVDQSTVDNSMEKWLEKIKDSIKWKYWLFGHYHADRIEKPHVEQFYNDIEDIEEIIKRWKVYDETGELPWYMVKGPNFDL